MTAQELAEKQLLNSPVHQLDLTEFMLVQSGTSVRETIGWMRLKSQHCAFIVGKGMKIIGIFTDRDVLRRIVTNPDTWERPIDEFMTANPQTVEPGCITQDAMDLMEQRRFRNVPVVAKDGEIKGNVTHFAIVKWLVDHYPEAVKNLPPDPENYSDERAGG